VIRFETHAGGGARRVGAGPLAAKLSGSTPQRLARAVAALKRHAATVARKHAAHKVREMMPSLAAHTASMQTTKDEWLCSTGMRRGLGRTAAPAQDGGRELRGAARGEGGARGALGAAAEAEEAGQPPPDGQRAQEPQDVAVRSPQFI
jgi:hypothetical protein